MAANSGASSEIANSVTKQPILRRHLSEERVDDEHKRIRDLANKVCQWMSQILGVEITPENYTEKLDTGVELCKLQNKLVAGGEEAKISYNENAKKKPPIAQENITEFIKWCKGFIHSDEVFESNDLVDHKRELKSQMRVLLCLDKVRQKYPGVPETIEEVIETQEMDTPNPNDPPDLTPKSEDNDKEKTQEVASSSQQCASDIDDESQPSSTKPASMEKPGGEESKKEDRETIDKSASVVTTANVSPNNSEIRSRPIARNGKFENKSPQPVIPDENTPSHDNSDTNCSYFYPLVILCLVSLVFLGGLYFFKK